MMNDLYMSYSIKEAYKAFNEDEVPVGCVIVFNDEVVAKAHNKKVKKKDPTSHAEIECIRKACKKLNTSNLDGCKMYVTLEPCIMCAGAIIQSRIKELYIGTLDNKGGAFGSNTDVLKIKGLNHYPKVYKNIRQKECSDVLKAFFKSKRSK